jgi:hypothetical protein
MIWAIDQFDGQKGAEAIWNLDGLCQIILDPVFVRSSWDPIKNSVSSEETFDLWSILFFALQELFT